MINVGINGMGRIGRTIIRQWLNREMGNNFNIVAVNNPGNPNEVTHLLKYDSVHGRLNETVNLNDDNSTLTIGDKTLTFHAQTDPAEINWGKDNVQLVIDATGIFKDKAGLGRHIHDTVKKVIMCAPGKDLDGTFVMGINDKLYDHDNHHIVSNASCTTNCLAPLAKVLNDKFKIKSGFMTTIHAYTSDQRILDGNHSDPRRSRSAALSMIPTTTGAAKAVGLVIPELKGKLDGFAVRVPTPDVSFVDLVCKLEKNVTIDEVNNAIREASENELKGILTYEDQPLVSVDFVGMKESSCVDTAMTNIIDDMVKVVSWYDNEVGFSNRVVDLANLICSKL